MHVESRKIRLFSCRDSEERASVDDFLYKI